MRKSLIILLASLMLSFGTASASMVTGVSINHDEEFTIAKIDVDGEVHYTHQTEIAKDGKPFRIIIDILAATHEIGPRKLVNLPDCKMTGIRSSQYAVNPENIVRIVFEMKDETAYRVDADEFSVNIYVYDPDAKQFPSWSSYDDINGLDTSTSTTASIDLPAVEAPVTESTATKTIPEAGDPEGIIAAINQALDEDRQSSLESVSVLPEEKPESSKIKETTDSNAAAKLLDSTKTAAQILEEINRATALSFEILNELPAPVVESTRTHVAAAMPAETTTSIITAESISTTTDIPVKQTNTTPSLDQPETTFEDVQDSIEGVEDSTEPVKKSLLPQSPNKTESGKLADVSVETGTIAAVETDDKSTARFRRDPLKSKKLRGTLVAEFPTRLVIKYNGKNYRDPFETLINETKVEHNPMEVRVPNIEGLRLVGILEAFDQGNSALFEAKDGYGYILKAGDKVQKGYVLRVDENRVYFQIFEYGWSRTVALDMEMF